MQEEDGGKLVKIDSIENITVPSSVLVHPSVNTFTKTGYIHNPKTTCIRIIKE